MKELIKVDKRICPYNHVCPLINAYTVWVVLQDAEDFPVMDYTEQ